MKKLIILSSLILVLVGCKDKRIEQSNKNINKDSKNVIEQSKNDNPIKLALYEYKDNQYIKTKEYFSSMDHMKDIAVFSVIYTDQDIVNGSNIKTLWNEYYNKYENIENYKLGYEISFTLNDGQTFDETILKPLDCFSFTFSKYLYIWLYDDINQTASWYSHLEKDDYNEKTIMSSIKLMSIYESDKISSPISLTVFTYKDDNDFDKSGKYIGSSKFTMLIKRKN